MDWNQQIINKLDIIINGNAMIITTLGELLSEVKEINEKQNHENQKGTKSCIGVPHKK